MKEDALYELSLKQKKGEKERNIIYTSLSNTNSIADYLLPEANLTVSEKVQIFSLRSEINKENPSNFSEKSNVRWNAHRSEKIYTF